MWYVGRDLRMEDERYVEPLFFPAGSKEEASTKSWEFDNLDPYSSYWTHYVGRHRKNA